MSYTKTGFSFYSVDTDRYQDRKIKQLKKNFGCKGIAVYDYILCEIYRVKGCFLEWDANTVFDVAEYFGLEENTVTEVVKYCAAVGLFDKGLLGRGVITSVSVQRRYLEMSAKARRKGVTIPEDYLLVNVTDGKIEDNDAVASEAPGVSPVIDDTPLPVVPVQRLSLDEEIVLLSQEDMWLDQLQVLHELDKSTLKLLLSKDYKAQCIAGGVTGHINIKDAKSHFNNWIFKFKNNNNGNKNRRRSSEVRAVSAQDYEGQF